jgi:hypothetical protein
MRRVSVSIQIWIADSYKYSKLLNVNYFSYTFLPNVKLNEALHKPSLP